MRPQKNEAPGRCSGEGARVIPTKDSKARVTQREANAQATCFREASQ